MPNETYPPSIHPVDSLSIHNNVSVEQFNQKFNIGILIQNQSLNPFIKVLEAFAVKQVGVKFNFQFLNSEADQDGSLFCIIILKSIKDLKVSGLSDLLLKNELVET